MRVEVEWEGAGTAQSYISYVWVILKSKLYKNCAQEIYYKESFMLKMETKTVHCVDYRDWDNFMKKEFPNCPYDSIVSEEEVGNDSTWSCKVGGDMSRADMEIIRIYLEGGEIPFIRPDTMSIISYLASTGNLLVGNYNIKISW
jgi:hypothetical protein